MRQRYPEEMLLFALLACTDPAPPPAVPPPTPPPVASTPWETITPGLEAATLPLGRPGLLGPGAAEILRVDPRLLSLDLFMASEEGREGRSGPDWMDHDPTVLALINPNMYRDDYRSAVGLLLAHGHKNQTATAGGHRSLLLAQPRRAGQPIFALSRECDDSLPYRDFDLVAQSIRMIGCDGLPTWVDQPRWWSAALIGQDHDGRALFIHVRAPYAMRELTLALQALPLDLVALHYGEGGPEATLCLRRPSGVHCAVGSYETGFYESDDNTVAYPIPNVLVVRPRPKANNSP